MISGERRQKTNVQNGAKLFGLHGQKASCERNAVKSCRAMEQQAKAIGHGTMDPRWAAPAIVEAWGYATMSLSKGYLDRLHAEAIIGAIEAFTSSRLKR